MREQTRQLWVPAGDGVPLNVVVAGPEQASCTVVLTHGYAQGSRCWHHQVATLAAAGVRVVAWDLRGHGRSGRGEASRCTIDQLADDLGRVVRRVVPEGELVLVGHSMGGMTLMALAQRDEVLVRDRVRAMALLATSAAGDNLASFGLGPRVGHLVQAAGGWLFGLLARNRRSWQLVRSFGPVLWAAVWLTCCGRGTSRADARLTADLVGEAGFATMAAFLPTLRQHDRLVALDALAGRRLLVLNGSADLVVPPAASEAIARRLPGARRVVVPGAGHNVMLAAPDLVGRELLRLCRPDDGRDDGREKVSGSAA